MRGRERKKARGRTRASTRAYLHKQRQDCDCSIESSSGKENGKVKVEVKENANLPANIFRPTSTLKVFVALTSLGLIWRALSEQTRFVRLDNPRPVQFCAPHQCGQRHRLALFMNELVAQKQTNLHSNNKELNQTTLVPAVHPI